MLPGPLPEGKTWELVLSMAAAFTAAALAWRAHRRPIDAADGQRTSGVIGNWWGIPAMIDALVTRPVKALAHACAVFDRKVVDAGVRMAADGAAFLSRAVARVAEQRLDERVHRMADGWLQLADAFRRRLEALIDAGVDRVGALIGAAADKGRKTQTGAIPTYLSMLTAGFFCLWLILIIGVN